MPERQADRDRVCIGAITGAVGIGGEVRIKPFTAKPQAIAAYGPVSDDAGRSYTLTVVRPVKGGVAARLSGVTDRTAAEAIAGTRLYVPRAALPDPEEDDDYYHADLIGLAAETVDGAAVGTVKAIYNFGAGDVLEIAAPGGADSVMVAFTRDAVPVVDVSGGRIVVVIEQDES